MPTFRAPGSDSPPPSSSDKGLNLFSNLPSAPSGGIGSKESDLFAKPSNDGRETQTAAPTSLFGNSVNSTTSLDDLLTWPSSAKKPAAQKSTGPSLFSQPPSQSKEKSSLFTGNTLFGANAAKPSLFGNTQSNLPTGDDNMASRSGPSMSDFGSPVFSRSVHGPDQSTKPASTLHHETSPNSKVEERQTLSRLPDKSKTEPPKRKVVPREGESPLPDIVKNIVAVAPVAQINESSSLIAKTEDAISRLYESLSGNDVTDEKADDILSVAANDLVTLWDKSLPQVKENRPFGSVGPGLHSSDFAKANFLASLLLPLCHPPVSKEEEASAGSYIRRVPFQSFAHAVSSDTKESIPKVLLNWLNRHHPAHPEITEALRSVQPNPTASLNFWTTLNYLVLRANFSHAIKLLENADFSVARSALEDGYETTGYRGQQLQNVQKVVNTAVRNLRASPAHNKNWDIKGMDWSVYRQQIEGAVGELDALVELRRYSPGTTRYSARLGLPNQQGTGVTFTYAARMADTQLPLTIYQRLKTMYNIILGDVEAVLENAQDWVEATVGLTCWWDGEDDTESLRKQGLSSLKRLVDENPREAYLRRLACAFATATTEAGADGQAASYQINSFEPVEVGLASVFEGDVEGVIRLLQYWSLPVAAAVAEVGVQGGWYKVHEAIPALPGLSEDDRMILNYGQDNQPLRKDDVVVNYARALFSMGKIEDGNGARESWELALEVLGRLEATDLMKRQVSEMIDEIPLDTAGQMDRVVLLCTELGFSEQGRRVSERYGDKIAETSEDYGMALLCYARGHCKKKIKNVIDLLTSFCLVQSIAYPPVQKLDPELRALLYDPQTSFRAIGSVDPAGAEMLNFYFCGYAAVRRFYEIRDEGISLQKGERPRHRPLARKKAAAETLVALIKSASACISGGLYDYESESAVQIDGLMVLLGEALVFCREPNRFFTVDQQYDMLAAIEDLETVTKRVYEQCEECLQSTLWHHTRFDNVLGAKDSASTSSQKPDFSFSISTGSGVPTKSLLSKSISSEAPVSGFSLIGNELLESEEEFEGGLFYTEGKESKERIESKREWDWRTGIQEGIEGAEILRMLRVQLAKGLSFDALEY